MPKRQNAIQQNARRKRRGKRRRNFATTSLMYLPALNKSSIIGSEYINDLNQPEREVKL